MNAREEIPVTALNDPGICKQLLLAWIESEPGTPNAHEEGGFLLRCDDGSLLVERWSKGLQDEITVPEHEGGKWNGMTIIASFHTHPNSGVEFLQEPSPTDIRAVRDDPDLAHAGYEGEIVIASELVYVISRSGSVSVAGRTTELLGNT
jgi:hypothetical protein